MIGLIGGMSWESSTEYYRRINEGVRARRGLLASARCLLWSFDFCEIDRLHRDGNWDELAARTMHAARRLEADGADMLLICSHTMHETAEYVRQAVSIPLLHIADPVAARMKAEGIHKLGLLDTAFTEEAAVYTGPLVDVHGLGVLVPNAADRALLHRAVHDEVVVCSAPTARRDAHRTVIARMVADGAEAIILERTEILPQLWPPNDSPVPMFDLIALHADAAVAMALEG